MGVAEIQQRMLSAIDDSYDKSKGSFYYDTTMPTAIEFDKITKEIADMYDKGFAATCTGTDLDRVCYEQGIERKPATFARGTVQVKGIAGAVVPVGELVASDTAAFSFAEGGVIGAVGTITVPVTAVAAGQGGNVPALAVKDFPKTIEGLREVINTAAIAGGYDAESDESLRDRYYIKCRTPGTSGNIWHYLGWAKSVVGVGDARVFPLWNGAGTVKVVIISAEKRAAGAELIADTAAYIEKNRPIGATVTVVSAAELPINIAVTVVLLPGYTADTVKTAIASAIKKYLAEIAFKENYISYAKIGSILLDCEGMADYSALRLNGATANIAISDEQIAVLGGVVVG